MSAVCHKLHTFIIT